MSWGRETATQPRMAEDAHGNRRYRVHGGSCAWCGRQATTRGLFVYRMRGALDFHMHVPVDEERFCNQECYRSYHE